MENLEKNGWENNVASDSAGARALPVAAETALEERRAEWAAWGVVAFALALRLAWLGMKPPHFDEGVNGFFIEEMTHKGFYHYDPANYHGPFHFYVLYLMQTLFGRSVVSMRLPLVLINTATVWLFLKFDRFIPRRACFIAALAFAVSPGMVFYCRYGIHESWLLFGMVMCAWGGAEMWTRGTLRGLWSVALGVTMMILNKETYIIHLVSFALAGGTLWLLEGRIPSDSSAGPAKQEWSWDDFWKVASVCLLLIVFFYSGGFLDPASLQGLYTTYSEWFQTGMTGNGHEKAWYYWLELCGQYEWPVCIGMLYSVRAVFPGMNRFARYIAIYGWGALVAYSIVHYKTPWCIISIMWPFMFLFGDAVHTLLALLEKRPGGEPLGKEAWRTNARIPMAATAIVLGASLAASARLNYFHPTDAHEKYVYVQTVNDLYKLTGPLDKLVEINPAAYHMMINLMLSSYHPLAWLLGDFTSVGFYDKMEQKPPVMDAGVIAAEEDRVAEVEARLQEKYFVEPFQLREAMLNGKLYLNCKWFAPVFPGRKPDLDPSAADPSDPGSTLEDEKDISAPHDGGGAAPQSNPASNPLTPAPSPQK